MTAEDLVWICAHVEQMAERNEYVSVPRAEWDAMTENQQEAFLSEAAVQAMNNAGGCGASVVDESDVPDDEKG